MVITLLLSSLLGSLIGVVLGLHWEMGNMTIGLFYLLGGMTGVTLALMRAMSRTRKCNTAMTEPVSDTAPQLSN
ncbi:MAG: hypothetical protein AAFO97_00035 [Pseudomonadota bacterium]